MIGSWSGLRYQESLAKEFEASHTDVRISVKGVSNRAGVEQFCRGESNILIYSGRMAAKDRRLIRKTFFKDKEPTRPADYDRRRVPAEKRLESFPVGRFAAFVVAHKSNTVRQLSYKQIYGLLRRRPLTWADLGGPKLPISVHGTKVDSKGHEIIKNECMGIWLFRNDVHRHRNDTSIIRAVAKDKAALGYFLYRQQPVKAVKILAIGKDDKGPFYLPTPENIFEGKYPLSEELTLYLHPKASPLAKEYCKFAISQEGAKIAKKWYLYPGYERQQYFAKKRLKEMKAGKGVRIGAIGVKSGQKLIKDLAVDYVKAKAVIQMRYAPTEEMSAVGYFLADRKGSGMELLLLNGKPSQQAMKVHGKKWKKLWLAANGSERDVRPIEHIIAGRGVAIVVHSLNKLDSLTLDQVRSVFAGKVKDWKILVGGTGEKTLEIHRFGLHRSDLTTDLFYDRVLGSRQCGPIKRKKDTAAVLAAMSIDPQGIAFVNFADLPADPDKSSIKVLSVGPAGKAAQPTAETILDGSYPLSQRLHLYVSPKACEVTKDFVKFILSGVCGETFGRHGLTR